MSENEDDIDSHQLIPEMLLVRDEMYNIAVCTDCCIGIPFDWIISHMKDNHGLKYDECKILEWLDVIAPTMKATEAKEWAKGHQCIPNPISGIPVQDGFGCNLCSYSARKKTAVYNHISKNHRNGCGSERIVERKVQKPFTGSLKQYIFVECVDNNEDEDIPDWRVTLKEKFNETINKLSQLKDGGGLDLRLVNAFVAKIR
jgi:hypothetical protein